MGKASWSVLLVLSMGAVPAVAQRPGSQPEALRRQILERFVENFRVQAGLTDEQYDRFRQVLVQSFRERRAMEAQLRERFRALEGQLRPGVAADEDSVVTLMAGITEIRQALVDLGDRDREVFAEFLSPIQQGQLILSLERFQRQIENLIRQRQNRIGDVPDG